MSKAWGSETVSAWHLKPGSRAGLSQGGGVPQQGAAAEKADFLLAARAKWAAYTIWLCYLLLGYELLFQPEIVRIYISLLKESKTPAILEASAGALQNLCAGRWTVSDRTREAASANGEPVWG